MSMTIMAPGYDLEKTLTCGQVFRFLELPGNIYQVVSRDKLCKAWMTADTLCIDCSEEDESYWARYFNPMAEPEELARLMSGNVILQAAYDYSKGIQLLKQDPFECLITFIISQQKRIPQIKAAVDKLSELCGREIAPGVYGFPEAKDITVGAVDGLRLGYRAPYVIHAVREVHNKEIVLENYTPDKVTYEEAMTRLQKLYGVGVKIANCVALFGLGFTNAFPVDTHIQQLWDLPEMDNFNPKAYGEYAGIVQQYLYNYALYNGY